MSVDRDEVLRIAGLAKLRIDDQEADRLADEMTRILEHAERLREVEDESPTPPDAPDGSGDAGGPREVTSGDIDSMERRPRDFAPEMTDGFFLVPPPPGVTAEDAG